MMASVTATWMNVSMSAPVYFLSGPLLWAKRQSWFKCVERRIVWYKRVKPPTDPQTRGGGDRRMAPASADAGVQPAPSAGNRADEPSPASATRPSRHDAGEGPLSASPAMVSREGSPPAKSPAEESKKGAQTSSPAVGSSDALPPATSPPEGDKKKKKKVGVGNKLTRQKEEVNEAIHRMGMVPTEEMGQVYDAMSHTCTPQTPDPTPQTLPPKPQTPTLNLIPQTQILHATPRPGGNPGANG